jgi:hypothetical protein
MSIPFGSNVLTFSDVARQLRTTFETFTDRRRGKNTRYTLVDAALSAFSVFFMQNLSFLGHQRTMQDMHGKDNAHLPGELAGGNVESSLHQAGHRLALGLTAGAAGLATGLMALRAETETFAVALREGTTYAACRFWMRPRRPR